MIRLHNDQIVDLSGAAAQYATTIANRILSTGQELSDQITEWQELDNQAIQTFNEIYNEVKSDKEAVTVLREEVDRQYDNIIVERNAVMDASMEAELSANRAESYKTTIEVKKEEIDQIKQQIDDELNKTYVYSGRAINAADDARRYSDNANVYATRAEQAKIEIVQYVNRADNAAEDAAYFAFNSHRDSDLALQAKEDAKTYSEQAGIFAQSASESATIAEGHKNSAQESEENAKQSADQAAEDAERIASKEDTIIEKENTITEILTSHANVKELTNDEIDAIWGDTYIPEDQSPLVDGDGIYNLPIPIPKIRDLFGGD